jgi:hypothetical protein
MRTVRTNRVEFDSSKQIREDADSIIVPTILTRESILPFADGRGYRSAKELQDAAWTLEGAWVVALSHISTVFVTNRVDIRGKVENVKFEPKINGIIGDTRFLKANCDQAFLEGVKKGELKDVSVAYFCEDVFTPGKFGDEPYDFLQQNFMFGHVAAGVPEGRCPSPFCGMAVDSLFAKHGDPEVTENYVRIRVRDPNLFVDGSFRTIILSADQGIHAIIGKLKSDPQGSTVIQNYMFEVAKDWTMEKAQAWVKEHKDSVEAMSLEGIKKKLKDLENQRTTIMEKLYPKSQLSEEEQQKLREELTVLDAETKAYIEFLAEKLSMIIESGTAGSAIQAQPKDVVARAKNHFNLSDEQWNALSEEEKQKYMSQLPPVGSQRQNAKDAEWTTEYVNDLSDSCFAYVEEGEKDADGKTVPRSKRHLPFKNADGSIDHDHLVNALARVKQSATMPEGGKRAAIEKLCGAVRSWNREHEEAKIESEVCGTEDSACSRLDPYEELARSRRYFHSNMSLFGAE